MGGCLWAELAGGSIFLLLALTIPPPALFQWLIWAGLLLALGLADWARQIIPNRLLLALAINRIVWFFVLKEEYFAIFETFLACIVPAALLALVLALVFMPRRRGRGSITDNVQPCGVHGIARAIRQKPGQGLHPEEKRPKNRTTGPRRRIYPQRGPVSFLLSPALPPGRRPGTDLFQLVIQPDIALMAAAGGRPGPFSL